MIISVIVSAGLFLSCNNDGATDTTISTSTMFIPPALVADTASRSAKGTSVSGTADNYFEPFRQSLAAADTILDRVNAIIDDINSIEIPETYATHTEMTTLRFQPTAQELIQKGLNGAPQQQQTHSFRLIITPV